MLTAPLETCASEAPHQADEIKDPKPKDPKWIGMVGRIGVPLTEPITLHFLICLTDPQLEMIKGFDVH